MRRAMKERIASDQPTMKEPASEEISKSEEEILKGRANKEISEISKIATAKCAMKGRIAKCAMKERIANKLTREMSMLKELAFKRTKAIARLLSESGVPPPDPLRVTSTRRHVLGISFSDPNTHILGISFPDPNKHVLDESSSTNPDSHKHVVLDESSPISPNSHKHVLDESGSTSPNSHALAESGPTNPNSHVLGKSSSTNPNILHESTSDPSLEEMIEKKYLRERLLKEKIIRKIIADANIFNKKENNFPSLREYNDYLKKTEDIIHDITTTLIEGIDSEEIEWYQTINSHDCMIEESEEGNREDHLDISVSGTEGNREDHADDSIYWEWKWKTLYHIFNKHEEDFHSLREYTNYLQDLEDITFGSMEWIDFATLTIVTNSADQIINYRDCGGVEEKEEETSSEMGEQTESKGRSVCTNYSRHGICKHGRFCRYDHSRPTTTAGG